MTNEKLDLRMVWELKADAGLHRDERTFIARVVYMEEPDGHTPNDAGVRNPGDWDSRTAPYASLGITGYFGGRDGWYGQHLHYIEPFRVDLRQAERMVKLLRKAHKALDRMDAELGAPTDLAAFCGRVARAIGCTSTRPFSQYHHELTMNGTHYLWLDVDGLRSTLTRLADDIIAAS